MPRSARVYVAVERDDLDGPRNLIVLIRSIALELDLPVPDINIMTTAEFVAAHDAAELLLVLLRLKTREPRPVPAIPDGVVGRSVGGRMQRGKSRLNAGRRWTYERRH